MNTAVNTNQFNYRFKLTDYSLFDRIEQEGSLFTAEFQRNTKLNYPLWIISCNGMMTKYAITRIGMWLQNILMRVSQEHRQRNDQIS